MGVVGANDQRASLIIENERKGKTTPPSQITQFFGNQKPYNKSNLIQLAFLENLVLYITKGFCSLFSIENH